MQLDDALLQEAIFISVKSTSKKQILQLMSQKAAALLDIEERSIFEALVARERLGSTGIGHGVAIPHARFKTVSTLSLFFAQLSHPVDFDAVDSKPVDLIFMLVAPEDAGSEHLKMLARISRLVRSEDLRNKLRGANEPEAIRVILTERSDPQAA